MWGGGHVRPREERSRTFDSAPPQRAAAAKMPVPAVAWCLLRVGPRGQMGGRTGTSGRGCAHGATVPLAARAAERQALPCANATTPKTTRLAPYCMQGTASTKGAQRGALMGGSSACKQKKQNEWCVECLGFETSCDSFGGGRWIWTCCTLHSVGLQS